MIASIFVTFPIASKPLSNSSRTPKNRKATPKPARPTPISKIKINELNLCVINIGKYWAHLLCVSDISNIFFYINLAMPLMILPEQFFQKRSIFNRSLLLSNYFYSTSSSRFEIIIEKTLFKDNTSLKQLFVTFS